MPELRTFLGEAVCHPSEVKDDITGVVGWGRKYGSKKGRAFARAKSIPYYSLEEGFIAYPPHGTKTALNNRVNPPYSIICDSKGIYYDATETNDLEYLLNSLPLGEYEEQSASLCRHSLLDANITKYNDTQAKELAFLNTSKECVLVVEQVYRDKSIAYGLADSSSFHRMLDAAIDENPNALIVLKTHPRILSGRTPGYLTRRAKKYNNIVICTDYVNPLHFLKKFSKVYTVSSQMGFEALLRGKTVRCFGMPFYAGWGLTLDELKCERRKRALSLDALFYCAYMMYPRYLHPVDRTRCELTDIIDHIKLQHRIRTDNKGRWLCVGMQKYKRKFVECYLQGASQVAFQKTVHREDVPKYDKFLTWGKTGVTRLKALGVRSHCLEDGFIRSKGLGASKVRPTSLIFDDTSIYFDGTQVSQLEQILNTHTFNEKELELASSVLSRCVDDNVSKYNLSVKAPLPDMFKTKDKKVILVPGQVPDDASIDFGSISIKTNLCLLAEVRRLNPDAIIIFKQHPDIFAGFRKDVVAKEQYEYYSDYYVTNVDILDCINKADEVHTMTSLTGFEALIRSKRVFTYGLPFYAGWGLTIDRHVCQRRQRKLKLLELIAGALIIYPRYFDYQSRSFTTVDHAIRKINQ